jgi:uncharacterized coiled-coil DUF342 family protein
MNMEEYKRRIDNAHTVTGVPTYWEELQKVTEERDSLLALLEESANNYKELSDKFKQLTEKFTELQNRIEQLYRQSEYWQNIASR